MRIVIADDHRILLDGLQALLATEGGMEVVATCADGMEAVEAVRETRPDILVLDLHMPKLNGLGVLRELVGDPDPPATVLLTAELDGEEALEAVKLGARGIVLKAEAPRRLTDCLRAVAGGERWLDPGMIQRALDAALAREAGRAAVRDDLTERELEVVQLVAEGLPNKTISRQLGISAGTVKVHLHNIFKKLDVSNRTKLSALARERGLV